MDKALLAADSPRLNEPIDINQYTNCDRNECSNTLAHIFQLKLDLRSNSVSDNTLLAVYESLKRAHLLENIDTLLKDIEAGKYIITEDKLKIFPQNAWFCKLVILASMKHYKELFQNDCVTTKNILKRSLAVFVSNRNESIHLLRLITNLVDFLDWEQDPNIAVDLIRFARIVALSPLNGFKQYAEDISKKAIHVATAQQQTELIDFLPLRGVSTMNLEHHFQNLTSNDPRFQKVVTRIIEMFSNNIENREGGILYKILLARVQGDFHLWKQTVWPQFCQKFQGIDWESEFFQSLLKYWIPTTVASYKTELHEFIWTTSIPNLLKGSIMLETRKKFILKTYDEQDLFFLEQLFCQKNTRSLALQIVGSPFKKKDVPTIAEMQFVLTFLMEQGKAINRQEIVVLQRFLTQIVLIITTLKLEEQYLKYMKTYLIKVFIYGVSLLKTSRRDLGAQILVTLCNGMVVEIAPLQEHLKSEYFAILVEQALFDSKGFNQELSELATKIVTEPKVFSNEFLMSFIYEVSNTLSIKASESVKNISHFIASISPKENIDNLHNSIYRALMLLFEGKWSINTDPKLIFQASLLFEALNQLFGKVLGVEAFKWIHSVCFPSVATMLQQKYYQSDQNPLMMSEEWFDTKNKTEKIVEALYNNLCLYLLNNKDMWSSVDCPTLINQLVRVIERSSMRKPTMISADLLKHAAISIAKQVEEAKASIEDDHEVHTLVNEEHNTHSLANFKSELLHETLRKLEKSVSVQVLTIRRNPESRLVLHALCVSDSSPQKHFLTITLDYLLKILSNDTSQNATTSSALHCIEILMSDNTLYSHTLNYTPAVILACVRHFKNRNWVVRNACVQLTKALIERFLGVLIGRNNRPKSVDDLFQLFPQIASPFYQVLTTYPLTDSALVVMQFFSESHLKKYPYSTEISLVTKEAFLRAFMVLIKENPDLYGFFAARAYTSLCLEYDIPCIIDHIVDFIIKNVQYIRSKHTTRNFMLLLQELYDKYVDSISDKPSEPKELNNIHKSFEQLTLFYRHFNMKQFDLLLVKVLSVREASTIIKQNMWFSSNDYHQRVWLHNYLPCLVINTSTTDLPNVLPTVLSKDLPECLQVKVLSILVDKFAKEHKLPSRIIEILVSKAFDVKDTSNYLLMCYFKVILLLFKNVNFANNTILNKIRRYYGSSNMNTCKIFISLLTLSTLEAKSDSDKTFVKLAVKHFENVQLTAEDIAENVSEMLEYLYKNSCCICDKRRILTFALVLLIEHGLWHFISFISKSNIPTPIRAMQKILDFHFLRTFFGSEIMAFEFVKEVYAAVSRDSDKNLLKGDNKTYYVEEECVFVDRDCIGRIVIKFLYEFCKFRNMDDWLEYYLEVRNKNRILI